ncbi:MAG: OmpA family protein [Deltaproteobacteria bacterium]|nr:OmpA family protein [Deltaproteobacteria bacterium]
MARKRYQNDGYHGFVDLMTSLFAILVLYIVVQSGATADPNKVAGPAYEPRGPDNLEGKGDKGRGGGVETSVTSGTNASQNIGQKNGSCSASKADPDLEVTCQPGLKVISISSDLLFNTNSADLTPEKERTIARAIYNHFREDCDTAESIEVGGHTDRQGDHKIGMNLELSQRRSLAVANVILRKSAEDGEAKHKCLNEKILAVGYGASKPAKNYTKDGSLDVPENRRVEIKIKKSPDGIRQ